MRRDPRRAVPPTRHYPDTPEKAPSKTSESFLTGQQLGSVVSPTQEQRSRACAFLAKRGLDDGPDSVAAILGLPWRQT